MIIFFKIFRFRFSDITIYAISLIYIAPESFLAEPGHRKIPELEDNIYKMVFWLLTLITINVPYH
jgi:hypothetical protein